MAQQSRALAALGEAPSLVASSQDHSNLPDLSPAPGSNLISSNSSRASWELKLQPTHALNPAPEGLMPSLDAQEPRTHVWHTHTHINKNTL